MASKLAPTGHNGDSAFNLWGAAFSASSEPDFWGRVLRPARNSNTSKGVVDFVNVLKVQGALLTTQEQWVESSTGVSLAMVGLYKALGGGWESVYPLADDVGRKASIDNRTAPVLQ
jgi:outer membrane protein TolC